MDRDHVGSRDPLEDLLGDIPGVEDTLGQVADGSSPLVEGGQMKESWVEVLRSLDPRHIPGIDPAQPHLHNIPDQDCRLHSPQDIVDPAAWQVVELAGDFLVASWPC